MSSKSWIWILLILILIAIAVWLWVELDDTRTALSECETKLDDCVSGSGSGGTPPPRPIIVVDPKASGVSAFSFDGHPGTAPTCITVTDDTLTSVAFGALNTFYTTIGIFTEDLDAMEVDLDYGGTPMTLRAELDTSNQFVWTLDGTTLTSATRGSNELRDELCSGTISEVRVVKDGSTASLVNDELIWIRAE